MLKISCIVNPYNKLEFIACYVMVKASKGIDIFIEVLLPLKRNEKNNTIFS